MVTDTELDDTRADGGKSVARIYSPDPRPPLQSVLDMLIDIDIAYEREREKLSTSSPDIICRARLLRKLKEQHCERRQPVIQQLMALRPADTD